MADTVENAVKTTHRTPLLCVNPAPVIWRESVKGDSVCGGRPPTFDLSVWKAMTAAANMSLLRRAEPAAAEQRLELPLC